MKSGMGIRECNSEFAFHRPERLNSYPINKRELNRLRYARRSARLRDRDRGFDRKTVSTNSWELAQALLPKRHLKIPSQAHWICQRVANSEMLRIMPRSSGGFPILSPPSFFSPSTELSDGFLWQPCEQTCEGFLSSPTRWQ